MTKLEALEKLNAALAILDVVGESVDKPKCDAEAKARVAAAIKHAKEGVLLAANWLWCIHEGPVSRCACCAQKEECPLLTKK
jgi:hypothetical protein